MKAEIQTYDENCPMLYIELGGHGYQFSVKPVDEDSRQWLLEVVSRQMQQVHNRATSAERKRMQKEFKGLLGIKEQS